GAQARVAVASPLQAIFVGDSSEGVFRQFLSPQLLSLQNEEPCLGKDLARIALRIARSRKGMFRAFHPEPPPVWDLRQKWGPRRL
ncbi:hypothetical protein, partial [Sphingomonas pituitosa]|uniref:hypothetical protein n=1 Tax=Sphingomonas pituitosa TaxID=99597 RepID=UPI001C3FAB3D